MGVPYDITLNPDTHILEVGCGQCGSCHSLIFEIKGGELIVSVGDSDDTVEARHNDGAQNFRTPIRILV